MPKPILILILFAILLSACGGEPTIAYTPPALDENWSVTMTLSGGIAGLMQNIEVNSDGSYTVSDQRAGNTKTGTLTETQRTQLKGMLEGFQFNSPKVPSGCADCFIYEVAITSSGKKMIVSADDVTLGDSGMGELVQFLRGIMDTALQ